MKYGMKINEVTTKWQKLNKGKYILYTVVGEQEVE